MKKRFQLIGADSPSGELREAQYDEVPLGYYVGATLFAFFSAAVCFYWAGFTLTNTVYTNGYTSLNQWHSSRYNWVDWWPVWLLTFNCSLPLLFAFAVTNNAVGVWGKIHRTFSYLCMLANIYALVVLTIGWLFYCNSGVSLDHSACNDYRICGVYFASPGGWCTNGMEFPAPYNLGYGDLQRNREMTEHWIYGFGFLLFAVFHTMVNRDYREYGILK